jgi:hypothetical protein
MAELAPVVFVLALVAVVGLPVWLLVGAHRRNRAMRDPAVGEAVAQLAAAKGWRYTAQDDRFADQFDGAGPFGRGARRRPALDLVTGTHRRREFACFQYAPPRRMRRHEQPVEIAYIRVFVVSLPTSVPSMQITSAGRTPRWSRRYTVGDESFDHAFMVGTDDAAFTSGILTDSLRRWLVDNPPPGRVRLLGSHLICWHDDRVGFDPQRIEVVLDYLTDLVDRMAVDRLPGAR